MAFPRLYAGGVSYTPRISRAIRLTLEPAERLLAGETVAGTDPDNAWKLLNYHAALERVTAYLNDGGAITEGLIRKIHRRLVAEVRGGSVAPSEYRRVQNYPTVRFASGESDEGGRSE